MAKTRSITISNETIAALRERTESGETVESAIKELLAETTEETDK